MASSCKYGVFTEEMIRDRSIIGIRDKATKLRLLKEEELDLNKALSICKSNEAASKQLNFMKQEEIQTDEQVNAVDSQTKRPDKRNQKKRKTQKMERMERAQGRIAADVEEQSNIGKKNAKHMVKHATCAQSQITLHLFVALRTSQQVERQCTEGTTA